MGSAAALYERGGSDGSAVLTATASGNTVVVAAVTAFRIRVLAVALMADAAVNVKFTDGTADLTGAFPLAANTGFVLNFNAGGWFVTAAVTRPVDVNLSTTANVGGVVVYAVVL